MMWLTSKNKKRHQRAMNQLIRRVNKSLEQDDLWGGRFVVHQIKSPQWSVYEDKSGAELFVHLEVIDRCTGRSWVGAHTVNEWRTTFGNGWRLYEFINWFIVEYCNVWEEPLAKTRHLDAWREYNRTVRKVK